MQIIIPMTGYGSRFKSAGYKKLKPFIEINGKPILQWIIDGMYPFEKNIIFICRQEHLDTIDGMKDTLLKIAPTAKIFAIDDWVKKGPVYDVLRASEIIDDSPCIINYCDFYQHWDWATFKKEVINQNCDGCIPCYTEFHPHLMIKKNLYASCKVDKNDNLIEIKEKYSFEEDKTKARHSPGIYYFKTGSILKKYCQKLVDDNCTLNGEFYASLPYNYMVKDGLKVWVPTNVKQFCQWGTPEDLKDYLFWTDMWLKLKDTNTNILIPMAGAGQRFVDAGYTTSKPAIPTLDRNTGELFPMVICATKDLPCVKDTGENVIYIGRDIHKSEGVVDLINKYYPKANFITLDKITDGQACTCLMARDRIDTVQPLLIAGCDNGMVMDNKKFNKLRQYCDFIVFTYRHNEAVIENPNAYGWVIVDNDDNIQGVSVKKAISDNPQEDHAIVATFWFKQGKQFVSATDKMIEMDDRINGEFYVDQVIKYALELGLKGKVFEIDRYIGWGTPSDYEIYMKTAEYWKEFLINEQDRV